MYLKRALAAITIIAFPFGASAIPFSQLDVVGNVNPSNSDYTPTGEVDFLDVGVASSATGIFADIVTFQESLNSSIDPTVFQLFDIEFEQTGPQLIYSGGGFDFFATSFSDLDNEFPIRGFFAEGFITSSSGNIPGEFSLSSQATSPDQVEVSFSSTTTVVPLPASALMLISALGGLGLLSYRRKAALA